MNVTASVNVERTGTGYPERVTKIRVEVELTDAERGEAVVGALDHTWKGVRSALDGSIGRL